MLLSAVAIIVFEEASVKKLSFFICLTIKFRPIFLFLLMNSCAFLLSQLNSLRTIVLCVLMLHSPRLLLAGWRRNIF